MRDLRRLRRKAVLPILIGLFLLSSPLAAGEIRVVASIPPLAGIAREVAGEGVGVRVLYPAGISPLEEDPGAEAVRGARGSSLYLKAGAGLERRADRLMDWPLRSAELAEGEDLIGVTAHEEAEDRIYSAALGLDESASGIRGNPYLWLDPLLVRDFADRVASLLSEADPGRRAQFEERARKLKARLDALDERIRRRLSGIGEKRFATFSGVASYFCRRYGLTEVPVTGVTPGGGPGRQSLKGTVARLRALGVEAVFTDPSFPRRPAETAARRAGVRLVVLEPFGRGGEDAGYFDTMSRFLDAVVAGLRS